MTFSIVAVDPVTGEAGCAVASKFLAVGAVVPWVVSDVGAIATQAFANVAYGPDGLDLLRSGRPAAEVVRQLTEADAEAEERQLGVVDAKGAAATFTGTNCLDWAGGVSGDGFAIQGNILAGPGVVPAMRDAYAASTGPLAERLFAALLAGDQAGGDRRGRQSAAIVVCRPQGGYGGMTDRLLDLRVDDHVDPVPELRRLMAIHELLFGDVDPANVMPIDEPLAAELRAHLAALGYQPGRGPAFDGDLEAALKAWAATENVEERWWGGDQIDLVVVEHLRRSAG